MFMGLLHHLMLRLNSGQGDSNVVERLQTGCPLDATEKEMCKKVRDLVYSYRQIEVEEIAQAIGISHGSVSTLLHDSLGMPKLTACWVPKSLRANTNHSISMQHVAEAF